MKELLSAVDRLDALSKEIRGLAEILQMMHDRSEDDAEEFTFLVGAAERLAAEASDIGKTVYEVERRG